MWHPPVWKRNLGTLYGDIAWGEVQGQLEQQTGTITAELNFDVVEEVRQSMPVAKHIRFEQHLH